LIVLLESAAAQGAQLVLFPELAFVTFFPRHADLMHNQGLLETYFESSDDLPNNLNTKPLFDRAIDLKVDICIGFAERAPDGNGYNSSIYFSAVEGRVLSKYRKVHLPGTDEPFPDSLAVNQLEKRYFTPGDLGFQTFRAPGLIQGVMKKPPLPIRTTSVAAVNTGKGDPIFGMLICNDRRWAEAWRSYGLQGVELVLCGYNTQAFALDAQGLPRPGMSVEEAEAEALFHHKLVMQSNSYTNSCFSVCAAKAGIEDEKHRLIAGSCIVNPLGKTVAEAITKDDEVVYAEVDLEDCRLGKEKMFDFGRHRRVEHYGLLTAQTGVVEPDLL
jgi:predicted amidohydrolase